MKWSGRGIGWLIAGALICATAFPGNGIADVISTIAIGLVFIVIFLMKQRFQPRGLGWFIAGGILLAFAVDCFFNQLGAFFSKDGGADSGLLSDMIIALMLLLTLLPYIRSRRLPRWPKSSMHGQLPRGPISSAIS